MTLRELLRDSEPDALRRAMEIERSNWPTLSLCSACEDCGAMFALPANARCPACESESVFDVAAALARRPSGHVASKLRHMALLLEKATEESA